MKITRMTAEGEHYGKAYMVIDAASEVVIDKVIAAFKELGYHDSWSTVVEEGYRSGSMSTSYLLDSTGGKYSQLESFKADWKKVKKMVK